MAETGQYLFTFKEVVEALLKQQGIHEGIWGLYIKFGIKAANIGPDENDIRPSAIIPILEIGLQKFEKESNIAIDAAKVNPKPTTKRKAK
ncbi:MAG: hypothetical protein A3F68_10280 [Acidobacteria bacterium RIFCSPLOWO2_12_FULL_54_10]|nr:MAG: hypothetical protein A3F68_10280 [Acidobacteria bacterium RIFCSPLOWO2_12_FULL_54_10]